MKEWVYKETGDFSQNLRIEVNEGNFLFRIFIQNPFLRMDIMEQITFL